MNINIKSDLKGKDDKIDGEVNVKINTGDLIDLTLKKERQRIEKLIEKQEEFDGEELLKFLNEPTDVPFWERTTFIRKAHLLGDIKGDAKVIKTIGT